MHIIITIWYQLISSHFSLFSCWFFDKQIIFALNTDVLGQDKNYSLFYISCTLKYTFMWFQFFTNDFSYDPLAKQGNEGREPQFFFRGPLKIGEVLLTKLRPGWGQVLSSCTVQLCKEVKMIFTQIVDNSQMERKGKPIISKPRAKILETKPKRLKFKQLF